MSTGEKQYGLVDPKTAKKITTSSVFGNDSDSGSDHGGEWIKKCGQKEEKGLKRQTKLQKALEQDPTVYQYDEIYDDMMQKKEEEAIKNPSDRKPKYIAALLKTAEKRKKENERRLERQIQKEREAEGDMYKDKEEFITSSYKQKLEEFKKAEEEEKKMEYIESVMDVSKQQDLGGFYRNFYKEMIGKANDEKTENNTEVKSKDPDALVEKKPIDEPKLERQYRKRSNSGCNDLDEKKSKQDSSSSSSDSDSSSDSSSTTSSSEEDRKSENKENESKPKESNHNVTEDCDYGKISEKMKKDEKVENKKSDSKGEIRNDSKKSDSKDEKSNSRNTSLRSSKQDDKDRRDRNYRPSSYNDRDRNSRGYRREERSYRDRERDRDRDRDRERERDRSRREDRRGRDGRERRRSDSRRRRRSRSRSSEGRRGRDKSRERRNERSRSRRRSQREREAEVQNATEEKKKAGKDVVNEVLKPEDERKVNEDTGTNPSIWEKRTVGAVLEAALERYFQRKAARGS